MIAPLVVRRQQILLTSCRESVRKGLKNIARPVRVYRVRGNETAAERQSLLQSSLVLPDKPSVAVLSFTDMSADPDQEFFADGIAEDVITALSRYPSLFVIARNSSFTYKGRAVDVKQIGRELGVRYVLEGSLRKSGNRIRVSAQLVEAETGKHIWAERYDRDLADIFAVQDEITEAVTIAIAPAIADAEQRRAMRSPPGSLDAWAAYQRGLWHLEKGNAEDNAIAERFFQEAISRDAGFAAGHTGLAWTQINAGGAFQTRKLDDAQRAAEASARRAVGLDPSDAEARACLAAALLTRGDFPGALLQAERARNMSPNLASAHGELGAALMLSGRVNEGTAALKTSIRLDPHSPRLAQRLTWIIMGRYFSNEYETAVEEAKEAIHSFPDYPPPYRWLAASLGQLGQQEAADRMLNQAISINPALFELYVRTRPPWFRPEDHAHMLEGLRKAGWEG